MHKHQLGNNDIVDARARGARRAIWPGREAATVFRTLRIQRTKDKALAARPFKASISHVPEESLQHGRGEVAQALAGGSPSSFQTAQTAGCAGETQRAC